jgi:hypothetical protein
LPQRLRQKAIGVRKVERKAKLKLERDRASSVKSTYCSVLFWDISRRSLGRELLSIRESGGGGEVTAREYGNDCILLLFPNDVLKLILDLLVAMLCSWCCRKFSSVFLL